METAAPDRTRSRRQRAGSRRNKRLRNVGPQERDNGTGRPWVFHCPDGTLSHVAPDCGYWYW